MPSKTSLKKLFLGKQRKMIASLEEVRGIEHPVAKGDTSEGCWVVMLNKHLPKRYKASKAFVVDHINQISDQIDVVIYDTQYSPLFFNEDGATYIPAESVYAVFEVKPEINKEYIEYAGNKAKSVRILKRTSAPIYHAGGVIGKPKKPFRIPAGILTFNSGWNPAFGKPFKEVISSLGEIDKIDMGCVINSGAFRVDESGEIKIGEKDTSLIDFFLDLLETLQTQGTVTALELDKYHKIIN